MSPFLLVDSKGNTAVLNQHNDNILVPYKEKQYIYTTPSVIYIIRDRFGVAQYWKRAERPERDNLWADFDLLNDCIKLFKSESEYQYVEDIPSLVRKRLRSDASIIAPKDIKYEIVEFLARDSYLPENTNG